MTTFTALRFIHPVMAHTMLWLRPQENFFLELSKDTLSQIPEQLLSMVGYSIHPPFMGMVNGLHPKRTLQENG